MIALPRCDASADEWPRRVPQLPEPFARWRQALDVARLWLLSELTRPCTSSEGRWFSGPGY